MTIPAESWTIEGHLKTHVTRLRAEAEQSVAAEIAALVRSRQARGLSTVLGLATGQTPIGVYRELVRMHAEESLDFSSVVTFNLDEYLGLGVNHPASFRRFMDDVLFDHVNIPPAAIHVPAGDLEGGDLSRFCDEYETAIREAGGIDLQLLGIGRNGHVAFNEPGSPPSSRTRKVALSERTRADAARFFEGHGPTPHFAVTMGMATILEARRLRVLAFGAHKAQIVKRALEGPTTDEVPATFLRGQPDVQLWLDEEAASDLERENR